MTLKKLKLIDIFVIFFLSFLVHFMYSCFPNSLFSIFFPVNESIWEHMKIVSTSIMIVSIIDYILLKNEKIKYNNFLTSIFLSIFLSIVFFLLIYLPLDYYLGENFLVSIFVLFITICFSQFISFFVLSSTDYDILNYISLIGIIFIYILFGILTYYPPLNDIFYDDHNERYGVNIYDV